MLGKCAKCGAELEFVDETDYNEYGLPVYEGCRDFYERCPECDAKTCPKCGSKMTFVHHYEDILLEGKIYEGQSPAHYNQCLKCGYRD